MKQMLAITKKELKGYFGSPMALIFLGTFLAVTLFSFFWVDAFFARGIADVRPLFRWMPVLMIFLVSALTMRQWSGEQREGTLELLMTLPISPIKLVLAKFLAVVVLVIVALLLTVGLPITVSLIGDLDWGPVWGGYIASVLLAAAYAGIGLFVSSRTDNQIVSLISSVLICGLFYLAGSGGVADFFGDRVGEVLRAIGSGSRFESIERGVIDLRDLLYYLSLTAFFLTLNVLSLESKRWSTGENTAAYRRDVSLSVVLILANLVALNVWVFPLHGLRLDLTEYHEYTLSDTTRDILADLNEPLLIRGYFSEKTHPLLAPLVPTVEDMLREYEIVSGGKVQLEIVDPAKEPEKEAEANQVYGIRPTPFQVSGKYEASIINSYFDILIRYGDQSTVLNFSDIIEVQQLRDGTVDVGLRNLEYDLTSAIKKTVYGFQSVDAVLASLDQPVELTLYVTPDTLPEWLVDAPATIEKVATELVEESRGKVTYHVVNPREPGSPVTEQDLYDTYGLEPLAVSLFSDQYYYLYMVMEFGEETQIVYPSGEVSEADVRTEIESALKRASSGFLKVVGLWTPPEQATQNTYGQTQQPLSTWQQLRESLRQEYEVRTLDLTTGQVPADVDVLVVVAPQSMTDLERFAIDQYLMRGGTVIAAAGNYGITLDQFMGGLAIQPLEDGLRDLLSAYGIDVEQALVMDPQNEPFPVTVNRQVGDYQVQEIQAIDYPFFVDIRPDGMAPDHPIVSGLPAVTMNWASPVNVDATKNAGRQVTTLLQSTAGSWKRTDTNIQPDFELYPEYGFATGSEHGAYPVAVVVEGVFESAFKGVGAPVDEVDLENPPDTQLGTIEVSPESARLVVFGSAEFLDDIVFQISSNLSMDRYLNNVKLLLNTVTWATEDTGLLDIRSRGTSARVLASLNDQQQSFLEGANYVIALLALAAVGIYGDVRRKGEKPLELLPPEKLSTAVQEVEQ